MVLGEQNWPRFRRELRDLLAEQQTEENSDFTRVQAEEGELRSRIISGKRPLLDDEWWIRREVSRDRAEERLRERQPVFTQIREWCGQGAVDEFN